MLWETLKSMLTEVKCGLLMAPAEYAPGPPPIPPSASPGFRFLRRANKPKTKISRQSTETWNMEKEMDQKKKRN